QKAKEAGVASAMRANNVRLIDPAQIPARPYKPKRLTNIAIGLMVGLFLGIAFVIMRERADHNIRAPGEAMSCLKTPELGAIPSAESASAFSRLLIADRTSRPQIAPSLPLAGIALPAAAPELLAWSKGSSILVDSFRAIL